VLQDWSSSNTCSKYCKRQERNYSILVNFILIFKNNNIFCAFSDTDSIIVHHAKGNEPIKSGQMLGEMQREYEDWHIMEYASGGAKQYGLQLKSRKNGEEKFILRIRVSFYLFI
jgi:hypothetical protein